ncbi:MAG TPA: ABC transporter ATP-binding protein, partial [Thermoprotei archaeon]|nr:ABC transporter ATP-binding protein [Thermoprotei archaeon]
LISLTIIPIIALTSYLFSRWTRKAYKKTREKIAKVTTSLEQTVSGAKVSQAFVTRKKIDIKRFEQTNREYFQASMEANKLFSSFSPVINLIRAGGIALLLWYGGMMVLGGRLSIGTLIAFYGYTERFFGPIISLTMFYNTIQSALAASERIYEFLHEDIEKDRPNAIKLKSIKGKIEYRHVYFSYDSETPLFRDLNLSIRPGETIAIVGPTGAGKTSLIKLLLRFHEIDDGAILLDNVDIRNIKLRSLRSHIGLVLQEDYLFRGTVLENIRIGDPNANIERVKKVVKELGIKEFIESLPNGYNTIVLEGGKNLSAGQRQLIAFARALLSNPKILILDEATSSVDPYTEKLIQNALEKLIQDKTCIIIAHRLSTVRLADRIVVLSDGRVVEEGSHEELLKKNGLYAKLYYEQLGGKVFPKIKSK